MTKKPGVYTLKIGRLLKDGKVGEKGGREGGWQPVSGKIHTVNTRCHKLTMYCVQGQGYDSPQGLADLSPSIGKTKILGF